MADSIKYVLEESRIPRDWYNLLSDLPVPPHPFCIRERSRRSGPTTWRRCFRCR